MQGFKILTAFCALVSLAAANDGRISFPGHQKKNICIDQEDGVFLPVAGSCTKYIICYNATALEHDCGAYHFSVKLSVCDLPAIAGCTLSGTLTSPLPLKPNTDKEIIVPNGKLPPCYAVTNGIRLPVPGNKRQYYYCMNNKAFLKDCGHLYFDVKYSVCGLSPDSSDSTIVERPSVVFPTKGPSIQHETEKSVCTGKPDGMKIPVAENSRQYHYCMNNKAFLKDCGSKLVFSTKYGACTLASEESVNSEKEVGKTYSEKIARELCANKPFGTRLGVPGSCSLFVICTVNNGYVKTCGWREFNSKTSSCDLPQNVRCQAYVKEEKEKQPNIHPSTSKPSLTILAEVICLNQMDGSFIASPGSCSEFFFCFKKQGFLKNCEKNRHFSQENQMCVNSNESKCVDTRFMDKKSQRALIPRDASSCVNVKSGTLISSSNSCEKFLMCDNGIPKEMDCPSGLHFNTQNSLCDYPTNAKCA